MTLVGSLLSFGRRRRALVIAATAILTIVAAFLCTRITFGGDVLNLLPQNSAALRGFRQYIERFGAGDQLYIVFEVAEGAQIEEAGALVDAYLARLGTLDEIGKVDAGLFDAGKNWAYLQERTFQLIGPAQTRAALARFDDAGMRDALARSRDLISTPSPEMRRLVQADPLGLLSLVRDHFAADRSLANLDVSRRGYVSADGRSRLVLASPTGPPFDSDFCHRLFDRLATVEAGARSEVAAAGSPTSPAVRIAYAGGHRIAVETEAIIKREATWNGVTSVAAILVLLLLVFRSPWLFLVGAIPMAVATLTSIAINGLIRDQLSAAATGTSALLFGLGIDGLVLLYARYLEEREASGSAPFAIERLTGAGTSVLLGYLTTAATFFGLTWIDVPGLQELGRLVAVGMLLGGPLTLLLVAALLPAHIARPRALSAFRLAAFVRRRHRVILAVATVITAIAVPATMGLDLDLRLQRLQPDTPAVRMQRDLGARFGVDRDVAIAVADGPDLDALLAIDRRLAQTIQATPPPQGVSGPSRLIPPLEEQAETGRILASVTPDITAIQARLRDRAFEMGFRPGAIDTFIERLPRLLDPAQRLTYQGYVDHGLIDLVARYVVPGVQGVPGAPGRDRVTTAAYVEVNGATDLEKTAEAARQIGAPLVLTGIPIVNADLAGRFPPQVALALGGGTIVVFLLMLTTFRDARLALLALSPTILGLVWAAAILARCSVSLDLFSIFAVLTLVGIGVDYGIHFVHRAATEPAGLDAALARVAPANLLAAAIAVFGVGSLVTSSYPPLQSLGIVTVVGLCMCLVTAVLVLPAMLIALERPASYRSSVNPEPRK